MLVIGFLQRMQKEQKRMDVNMLCTFSFLLIIIMFLIIIGVVRSVAQFSGRVFTITVIYAMVLRLIKEIKK